MSECENCEQLDYAAIIGDAKRFERERIIKLLEEAEPCECNPSWSYRCDTHFRIALIKGESK